MSADNNSKLSNKTYKAVMKPGTRLADSKETDGLKRAILLDENGNLKGPPELVPVEPEVIEKTVYQPVIVEKKPSIIGKVVSYIAPEAPDIIRDVVHVYKDTKARKQQKEIADARRAEALARRDAYLAKKEATAKELELEQFRAQQRAEEERRRKEAALSVEQRQIISHTKDLNEAYCNFLRDITKEEASRVLIRAMVNFVSEINEVKYTRVVDAETGEYVYGAEIIQEIPWTEILQNVNALLNANPNWLSRTQIALLSETFGREFITDGIYKPLRASELQSCLTAITEG